MRDRAIHKLIKASKDAIAKEVEHIVIIKHPDGTLTLNGTENILSSLKSNTDLYSGVMEVVMTSPSGAIPTTIFSYPLLPCSPNSLQWKSSSMIRSVLQTMITVAGYGKYGKKHGTGDPPLGWPVKDVPWQGFRGVTQSKLNNEDMTRIILGMLDAAGIDPDRHIQSGYAGDVPYPVLIEDGKDVVFQTDDQDNNDDENSRFDVMTDMAVEKDDEGDETWNLDGIESKADVAVKFDDLSGTEKVAEKHEKHEREDDNTEEEDSPMSIIIRTKGYQPIEVTLKRERTRKRPRAC